MKMKDIGTSMELKSGMICMVLTMMSIGRSMMMEKSGNPKQVMMMRMMTGPMKAAGKQKN